MILACALALLPQGPWETFETQQLSETFYSEGACGADIDGDGHGDINSGPFIYFGPEYSAWVKIYEQDPYDIQGYSDHFFSFAHDFDGDGDLDLLRVGFPGARAEWYENPGAGNIRVPGTAHWTRYLVFEGVDNESPTFADITGDGKPELICMFGGKLGWAEYDAAQPGKRWAFHAASGPDMGQRFTHGLGHGDINGDGRTDLMMRQGWWEQPASLAGDPEWAFHPYPFAGRGGAQMYAYDIDGDGDSDVVTSDNAHGYGLAWFEQRPNEDGSIGFTKRPIMGATPAENPSGVVIGNLHAMDVVDMNGDGLLDLVTGARFWAHGGGDAADHDPAYVYWFELERDAAGARFTPHLIDEDSGVGTQVVAVDLNNDQLPEIVVGNKNGTFVHKHGREMISERERRARLADAVRIARGRDSRARPGAIEPVGEDGKSLNLGFESGDLSGWTAEGEAFAKQPVQGDTVAARRAMRSMHAGEYWIGTYEIDDTDAPTGTLTSAPFTVTHPYASFLVGGGHHDDTCVELLDPLGRVFYRASGKDDETMHVRWVDLSGRVGQPMQIRLQDKQTGHWGHINFDDFRFHTDDAIVREKATRGMQQGAIRGKLAEEAAQAMTVPEGFHVDLIAAEPDLHQPIQFTIDAKGRMWVVEAYAYPQRRKDEDAHDTILVFEDTDQDGSYDKRTTFIDTLNLVSGIEVGFGGVWVGAAPYLMFIPDANDDLVPDSEPQILLDGWGYQDTHETLNAFRWGPDGWLYGCHGVFTHSKVGKPGTPDAEREPMNAGVWRYHPSKHIFEIFAWGTSNPWGVDWDDYGRPVITACVIPHLYHMIQGGRYIRQGGSHFSPYIYEEIDTIADHLHYLGATPHSGNGLSESVGGGHAHCGAMIYLSEQFPAEYRNRLFMFNVHGKRINNEMLVDRDSGLVGSHAPDFLLSNDPWFMGVALRTGPDGSVYFIDWYDKQACHRNEPGLWDRSNGRMYRVRYGDGDFSAVDLTASSTQELCEAMRSKNEWVVRTARRLLQERSLAPDWDSQADGARAALAEIFQDTALDVPTRLRALWAMHVTNTWSGEFVEPLLADAEEHVRAWTVQLLIEAAGGTAYGKSLVPQRPVNALAELAATDPSPVVRLAIASAMQRLTVPQRWPLAEALMAHGEDAEDHNLPKMIWYGFEPCVAADPGRALALVQASCQLDIVERSTYRRLAEGDTSMLEALTSSIATADLAPAERMLNAMSRGLASRPDTKMPYSWGKVSMRFLSPSHPDRAQASAQARDQALSLAQKFGDPTAAEALLAIAADRTAARDRRIAALEALGSSKHAGYTDLVLSLIEDTALLSEVLPRLAAVDDPRVAPRLIAAMSQWASAEQAAAAHALASRVGTAQQMLAAMAAKKVPTILLDSAPLRRQLNELRDENITRSLGVLWGRSAAVSASSAEQIAAWKKKLTPDALASADLSNGRAVYRTTCYACHTLFGDGQLLGPDITGSNRADLDYLLSNLIEPSAELGQQYMLNVARLADGRVVSGMISEQNEQTLTFRNGAFSETVRRSDLAKRPDGTLDITQLPTSLMPAGQLDGLSENDARDLVAYLASPVQQPLPADPTTLKEWFDGSSLNGWLYDPAIWSVENGEIIGRAPNGIDHNTWAVGPLRFTDFRMTVEVKLVGDIGNSGIQVRSSRALDGEVSGLQADIGAGWWGKLYEEHGRGLLEDAGGAEHVKRGDWNTYEILLTGNRIQTALNGQQVVDRTDPEIAQQGIVALQLHSGGPTEVRFRNFSLELSPSPQLTTTNK